MPHLSNEFFFGILLYKFFFLLGHTRLLDRSYLYYTWQFFNKNYYTDAIPTREYPIYLCEKYCIINIDSMQYYSL